MFQYFTKAFLLKFLKFGIVGCSGVIIDFGITYICKEYLKIQKYIANACGFTFAATSNYFLNRIWTFHSTNPEIAFEYFRFFAISLIGLALSTFFLWILVSKFKKNFYLSKLFVIVIVMVWNFFANLLFTFS